MALPDQFRELLKYRCHVGAVFCVRERHTIRQIQQGMVFIIKGGRFAGHQEPVLFQQVNPRLVHEMAEIAADGQSSRGQDTGDVTVPNILVKQIIQFLGQRTDLTGGNAGMLQPAD